MARRVFIHVGPPKTGTTYLQAAWFQHRPELAAGGLLYPGSQERDQLRACAIAIERGVVARTMSPRHTGTWDRFLTEIRAWDGDALLSCEQYAVSGAPMPERVLRTLAGVADEVHLVVTARDLARQIPAAWQEGVKHGRHETFESYWRRLADPASGFWAAQDLPSMIERWSVGLPPAHVHLVVHGRPGSDRSLLWQRMCQVTGVDPGILRPVKRSNETIGAVKAELLRRANVHRPGRVDRRSLGRYVKTTVLGEVLSRVGSSVPITMPPEGQAWAVERGQAMVDALAPRGYDVHGDLGDLVPGPEPLPGEVPDLVTDTELLELATPVISRLLIRDLEATRRRERLEEQIHLLEEQLAEQAGRAAPAVPRVRRAARAAVRRVRG